MRLALLGLALHACGAELTRVGSDDLMNVSCTSLRRGNRASGFRVRRLPGGRWLKCASARSSLYGSREARCGGFGPLPNSIEAEQSAYARLALAGARVAAPLLEQRDDGVVLGHAGAPLRRKNLPADALAQVAAIATQLRAANVSHNDIKREDLFVSAAGRLTLVDFGYSTQTFSAHVARREAGCMGQSLWRISVAARTLWTLHRRPSDPPRLDPCGGRPRRRRARAALGRLRRGARAAGGGQLRQHVELPRGRPDADGLARRHV